MSVSFNFVHGTKSYKVIHTFNVLDEFKSYILSSLEKNNLEKLNFFISIYYKNLFILFSIIKNDLLFNNYLPSIKLDLVSTYIIVVSSVKEHLLSFIFFLDPSFEYFSRLFFVYSVYIDSFLFQIKSFL